MAWLLIETMVKGSISCVLWQKLSSANLRLDQEGTNQAKQKKVTLTKQIQHLS